MWVRAYVCVCVCAFHCVLKLIIDLNEHVSEIIDESTINRFPSLTKTILGHYSHSGLLSVI